MAKASKQRCLCPSPASELRALDITKRKSHCFPNNWEITIELCQPGNARTEQRSNSFRCHGLLVGAGGFTDWNLLDSKGYGPQMHGVKRTTLTSMPPVPMFELYFSVRPSIYGRPHLIYPCQKRWLPGMREKQEPPRIAPPGAPTCSHESLVGLFTHAHHQPDRGRHASLNPMWFPTEGKSRASGTSIPSMPTKKSKHGLHRRTWSH